MGPPFRIRCHSCFLGMTIEWNGLRIIYESICRVYGPDEEDIYNRIMCCSSTGNIWLSKSNNSQLLLRNCVPSFSKMFVIENVGGKWEKFAIIIYGYTSETLSLHLSGLQYHIPWRRTWTRGVPTKVSSELHSLAVCFVFISVQL